MPTGNCPDCGEALLEGAVFCSQCGRRIGERAEVDDPADDGTTDDGADDGPPDARDDDRTDGPDGDGAGDATADGEAPAGAHLPAAGASDGRSAADEAERSVEAEASDEAEAAGGTTGTAGRGAGETTDAAEQPEAGDAADDPGPPDDDTPDAGRAAGKAEAEQSLEPPKAGSPPSRFSVRPWHFVVSLSIGAGAAGVAWWSLVQLSLPWELAAVAGAVVVVVSYVHRYTSGAVGTALYAAAAVAVLTPLAKYLPPLLLGEGVSWRLIDILTWVIVVPGMALLTAALGRVFRTEAAERAAQHRE